MDSPIYTPFSRPIYLVAKPVGAACNLRCDYCYYLEKSNLYKGKPHHHTMDAATLELFVRKYIEAQTAPHCVFNWHGGETLLRPVEFYRRAVELQKKYGAGMLIENTIQTNGTLLNDEWCRFFKENNFLVGISIDGPEEFNDEYRRDINGYGSFSRIMRGIDLLKKHGVQWNVLAVVNDYNVDFPEEFYEFFATETGCEYLQFTPIVERVITKDSDTSLAAGTYRGDYTLTPHSVTPHKWGEFLCRIFDIWVRRDVGKVFVQLFDATLANHVGVTPGICTLAPTCGHAAVIEHNGDIYSCDHFVFPEFRLGNIHDKNLVEMMTSDRQIKFGEAKKKALPKQCRECDVNFLCNGECPKNRFALTSDGEPGLNYLCEGYRRFFHHSYPYMEFMKRELEEGRPPAGIMNRFPH